MSWLIVLQGFALGLSMIIPIGAQNAFVLNQGIKQRHHFTTATVCSVCDVALICLGIFGGGALLASNQTLLNAVTIGGIAFVLVYGINSLRSALFQTTPTEDENNTSILSSRKAVILGALAVTLLNPHVYLDTVVILGSIGGQFAQDERIAFAAGTLMASFTWFYGLSFGAAKLSHILAKDKVKCTIDLLVAAMMFFIAAKLAIQLFEQFNG